MVNFGENRPSIGWDIDLASSVIFFFEKPSFQIIANLCDILFQNTQDLTGAKILVFRKLSFSNPFRPPIKFLRLLLYSPELSTYVWGNISKVDFFDFVIIQIVFDYAVPEQYEAHSSRPRTYLPSRSGATHALRVLSSKSDLINYWKSLKTIKIHEISTDKSNESVLINSIWLMVQAFSKKEVEKNNIVSLSKKYILKFVIVEIFISPQYLEFSD